MDYSIVLRNKSDGSSNRPLDADTEIFREKYRQTSNVSGTKFQQLNVSLLGLQLSLPNPLKPGVK